MNKLGLSISKVRAIFVSHEHIDHITGIPALSKKYQLPVYITSATLKNSGIPIQEHLVNSLQPGAAIKIGDIEVHGFAKSHDAVDPHSFVITQQSLSIGVFTDLGHACNTVTKYFSQCNAVFLEANYCENMLANGSYPYHLKKRISSDKGHLSNLQALELFINYRSQHLTHLLLSHLSRNNNSQQVVKDLFAPHAGNTEVIIASRYHETPVYCVTSTSGLRFKPVNPVKQLSPQLSLFE